MFKFIRCTVDSISVPTMFSIGYSKWPTFQRAYVNKIILTQYVWSLTSSCLLYRCVCMCFCYVCIFCMSVYMCVCLCELWYIYIKEKRGKKKINQAPPLALLPRWYRDSINEPRSLLPWKHLWMRKGPVTVETVWMRNCLIGLTLWRWMQSRNWNVIILPS